MSYRKVRFTSTSNGATARMVVTTELLTEKGMVGVARLFPVSEAPKMETFQISPVYDTFEGAFGHDFDEVTA